MGKKRTFSFADLGVEDPITAKNLTMLTIRGNPAASLNYLLFEEALKVKEVIVEEVTEGGSVPELRLTNFSEKVIFIVDGTELAGAKQNRVVNASILIPPKSVTRIPVSCVEEGRWSYKTRKFHESKFAAPYSIRRETADFQKESLRQKRGYESDQGKVWSRVSEIAMEMEAPSATGAINDVYEQKFSDISDYTEEFKLKGTETGAAFFIGKKLVGIDIFDRLGTLQKVFTKLITGIAIEAMMAPPGEKTRTADSMKKSVRAMLTEANDAFFEKFQVIGMGEDWRYDEKKSFGKALYFEGDLIHFSAFGK